MAALVCDLCGGKLIMGAGGVATCDSCGMEHSADRMKEKVQEVKGIVQADSSHLVENYLDMATNAVKARNYSESESYCNKIIEVSPTNYKAWLLKGKAAGWQSTIKNPRFTESVYAFSRAIATAPDEEKEAVAEESKDDIKQLSLALINLRAERFFKWPDKEETTGFLKDISTVYETILQFVQVAGIVILPSDIMGPIATQIYETVNNTWNKVVVEEYSNVSGTRPDYVFEKFIERIDYCVLLMDKAITLSNEDNYTQRIAMCQNIIAFHESAINAASTKRMYDRIVISEELTDEAKSKRRQLIGQYKSKIAAIEQEEKNKVQAEAARKAAEKARDERIARENAQKRFDAYWAEHADEKKKLDKEKADIQKQINSINSSLNEKVADLNKEISAIPGTAEIANLNERIQKLTTDKNRLGFFRGKEKRALQTQIDQLEEEKMAVQDRITAAKKEIEQKISAVKDETTRKLKPLQRRMKAITNELTKAR